MRTLIYLLPIATIVGCKGPPASKHNIAILDDDITVKLLVEDPAIVTPIGIAVDEDDHIYVLESHTHSPESSYKGRPFDVIKRSVDKEKDGSIDNWNIYADSINDGMNLHYFNDELFVVQKDKVISLRDRDGDGESDHRDTILVMYPPQDVYDHAGLLGIEIDPTGWIYISRGNIGGQRYTITGTDGKSITNFGDGGNVFRIKMDGSDIEEIATGFWNPFDLKSSANGTLWLIDNDPDSRGPNRLVKIVDGADYGYKSLYGGSGIHPFNAWNGELPGTLPYYAGIGEAPSGITDATFTNLPTKYDNHLIITIWEENKIISIPMTGENPESNTQTLIQGDSTFHPVAVAASSGGDLYITDWVTRQYPNHGKGRIWKISGNKTINQISEVPLRLHEHLNDGLTFDQLKENLLSPDRHHRTIARKILGSAKFRNNVEELLSSLDPDLTKQALLIYLSNNRHLDSQILSDFISHRDVETQRIALIYCGVMSRKEQREQLDEIMQTGSLSPSNFETFLATKTHLDDDFIDALQNAKSRNNPAFKKTTDDNYLSSIVFNRTINDFIKSSALPYFSTPQQYLPQFIQLFEESSDGKLKADLIEIFKKCDNPGASLKLLAIAADQNEESSLRTMAINALDYHTLRYDTEMLEIFQKSRQPMREFALRYLSTSDDSLVIDKMIKLVSRDAKEQETWQIITGTKKEKITWKRVLSSTGLQIGEYYFKSKKNQCTTCHQVNGWGGHYGPDLSRIGSSKSGKQLAEALLQPSREIAPEWQGWLVTDEHGKSHVGRQIDVGRHSVELMNEVGEFVTYQNPKSYQPLSSSLMPVGLVSTMTQQEFDHLIYYLSQLK